MLLNYITWNVNPELFSIGPLTVRWYGALWALGIFLCLLIVSKLYKHEKLPDTWIDKQFLYVVIGAIVGARLGHCLFYEPDYYLSHPLEIVLPVHFYPDGDCQYQNDY